MERSAGMRRSRPAAQARGVPMRLLVTGAAGMLGLDVLRAGERAGHELVAVDLPELDITDADAVAQAFARIAPEAVLNCAAWTDVDGAETHVAAGASRSTRTARATSRAPPPQVGVPLVHVSTDYVFDGEACVDAVRRAASLRGVRPNGPALGLRPDQAGGRAAGACSLAAPRGRAQRVAVRDRRRELRGDDAAAGLRARGGAGGDRPGGLPDVDGASGAGAAGADRARGDGPRRTWRAPAMSPGTDSPPRSSARRRSSAAWRRPRRRTCRARRRARRGRRSSQSARTCCRCRRGRKAWRAISRRGLG